MSRLALFNLAFGFSVIAIAASAGAFIANDFTQAYLNSNAPLELLQWSVVLSKSAHGHFNLFGFLHIMLGLTLSYSPFDSRTKEMQTLGICAGTLAMGPGLWARALSEPASLTDFDVLSIVVGVLLSAALLAIFSHAIGLWQKFMRT